MLKYFFDKIKNNKIAMAIISLALPIIFINICQSLYQLIDTFWVGRIGANAIASVSVTFPVLFLLMSLGTGLTTAAAVLVSQYKGKNDSDKINLISSQVLIIIFFVSIIISIIGYFSAGFLLDILGTRPDIFRDALHYLKISIIGLPIVYLFYAFQSITRGMGDIKTSMYIIMGTVLLNVFLDPLFIFTFKMGVAGSAVATVICQLVSAIIALFILFRGKSDININLRDLKLNSGITKQLFSIGLPSALEQVLTAFGMFIMTILIVSFSAEVIASFSLGIRILVFILIPASGISVATSILVGQSFGCGDIEKVKSTTRMGSLISFSFLSFLGVILFIFANVIASIFIKDNRFVVREAGNFMRIMSLTFGMLGVQLAIVGTFVGIGNTRLSMFLSGFTLGFTFLLGFILSKVGLGFLGIWISYPIGNFVSLVITYIIYTRGKWEHKKIA